MPYSTTIAIIEDDNSIRESLSLYIKAKTLFNLVYVSRSVEEYIEKSSNNPAPNLLLLDIGLPGMSGLEAIPILKSKQPTVDIIMLTTYEEVDTIYQALCSGACSYISKRTSLPRIVDALHVVVNGGSYMSPSIARKITEHIQKGSGGKKVSMTQQQKTIIQHIIDGKKYGEIAELMDISINTVRFHIKKIYSTLEVTSKVELYKKYIDGEIK